MRDLTVLCMDLTVLCMDLTVLCMDLTVLSAKQIQEIPTKAAMAWRHFVHLFVLT